METQTLFSRHNKFISAENITILSVSSDDYMIFLRYYIYIYLCMNISICVCVCIYIYFCIYIYIYLEKAGRSGYCHSKWTQ